MTRGDIVEMVFIFGIAISLTYVGAAYFPRRWFILPANSGGETYFTAVMYTVILFNLLMTIHMISGIVFMMFGVVSGWWYLWQMLYLPSVAILLQVCPVFIVVAIAWSIGGIQWFGSLVSC